MTFWKSNIIGTENRLVFGWLDKVVERWGGLITKWYEEVFGDNGTFVIVQVIT